MCIEMVCCTDTGQVRQHNEDSIGGNQSLGLVVLADGMGGYQAGEVASQIAVKTIMEQLYVFFQIQSPFEHRTHHYHYHLTTILLEQAVIKANQVIYHKAKQRSQCQGMGTTVVAALFDNHFMSIAHVGDSRLYRLRGNELRQMTKDHSVYQELLDCGFYTQEQAHFSPHKNLLTRVLGVSQQVNVEIQENNVLAQDKYILCSDGLSDMLNENDMYTILSHHPNSLEQSAQLLTQAANNKGGKEIFPLF